MEAAGEIMILIHQSHKQRFPGMPPGNLYLIYGMRYIARLLL